MTRRFLNRILLSAVLSALQISVRADLLKSSILENGVAYLRVGDVGEKLPDEIQSAENALATTNKISGTVLDLRLAGGDDVDSAKSVAGWLTREKLPVAILMDGETRGAAIELAKDLRVARAGLIFGSSTNVLPDISVPVSAGAEKQFLENPWATIPTNQIHPAANTNDFLPFIDRTTEADLVRARIKDGEEDDTTAESEPQPPFIRDPVLARGVDFIKSVAVLNLSHS